MIKLKSICFFALVAVLALSCNDKELHSLQDDVLQDIFPEFLIGLDIRKIPPPPPPPGMEKPLKIDESFFNDSRKMLVVVNDSIAIPTIRENIEHIFMLGDKEIGNEFLSNKKVKFEFDDFKYDTQYIKVLPASVFEKKKAFYMKKYYSGGMLFFSRIMFNPSKKKGIISVSYIREQQDGSGYVYFLAYNGEKWEITKSQLLWIS